MPAQIHLGVPTKKKKKMGKKNGPTKVRTLDLHNSYARTTFYLRSKTLLWHENQTHTINRHFKLIFQFAPYLEKFPQLNNKKSPAAMLGCAGFLPFTFFTHLLSSEQPMEGGDHPVGRVATILQGSTNPCQRVCDRSPQ